MLPDFPKLKGQLGRQLIAAFKREVALNAPLVSQVRSVAQHEGSGGSYETEDGDIKQRTPQEMSVPVESPDVETVPSFGPEDALQKIKDAAKSMASKKTKALLSAVSEATEEGGNAVDAEGQPLDAELILKVWENMRFSFDEQGKPQMPTLVFNPIQGQRVEEAYRRLATEPELMKRREEIINRHRLDWYDRESNRELVD
jgi:hypothetical protein